MADPIAPQTGATLGTLTTREIANHYQVTPRTIANWRAQGRITFLRITARCIRYRLADVEKALSK